MYKLLARATDPGPGPVSIPLAEDVVHDALVSAMHAWRFGLPQDPKGWIIRAARNRAIDIIRREQRHRSLLPGLASHGADRSVEAAGPGAERAKQARDQIRGVRPRTTASECDLPLGVQVYGPAGFPSISKTIDRRLHRGRGGLRQLGGLPDVEDLPDIGARRDSVLRSLYLLFNEGYHGSSPKDPVRPFLCEDALRLTELMVDANPAAHPDVHALAALFCFDSARLRPASTRTACSSPLRTRTGAAGTGRASSAV